MQSETTSVASDASRSTDMQCNAVAPNWDQVPFEVACARCGRNLRGLAEPRCPECGLEFAWTDAVPLEQLICRNCEYHLFGLSETRCPECGTSFTWEQALDDYRRKQNPLFEYRIRDRFFRSLIRTWLWALWPPKLWRRVDIHDPPKVRPLILWVIVACVLCLGVRVLISGPYIWIRMYQSASPAVLPFVWEQLPSVIAWPLTDQDVYVEVGALIIWLITSLAALMVFRQSMRRCKVRTAHVVRVWAYATPTILPLRQVVLYGLLFGAIVGLGRPPAASLYPVIVSGVLLHVIWSTQQGYKRYLRMPHSLAVGSCAQLMAVLAAMALWDAFLPGALGTAMIVEFGELLGVL